MCGVSMMHHAYLHTCTQNTNTHAEPMKYIHNKKKVRTIPILLVSPRPTLHTPNTHTSSPLIPLIFMQPQQQRHLFTRDLLLI